MKPSAAFRTQFYYNNYIYCLGGVVSELLSGGKTWEQLVQEVIFDPLGMGSSGFIDKVEKSPPGLAKAYASVNGSLFELAEELPL